jgi:hypothetical protein
MSLQYVHLLIADRVDFTPQPEQVVEFLENLKKLESAPTGATLRVGKLSGQFRKGFSALTGEMISVPKREYVSLGSISEIPAQLSGLGDYDVVTSGQGPAKFPPFKLYTITAPAGLQTGRGSPIEPEFTQRYGYEVRCCLRSEAVFHPPLSGLTVERPNTACARFWIEFQFGKWLVPKIDDSLNVLSTSLLAKAIECFGTGFAQGCRCL